MSNQNGTNLWEAVLRRKQQASGSSADPAASHSTNNAPRGIVLLELLAGREERENSASPLDGGGMNSDSKGEKGSTGYSPGRELLAALGGEPGASDSVEGGVGYAFYDGSHSPDGEEGAAANLSLSVWLADCGDKKTKDGDGGCSLNAVLDLAAASSKSISNPEVGMGLAIAACVDLSRPGDLPRTLEELGAGIDRAMEARSSDRGKERVRRIVAAGFSSPALVEEEGGGVASIAGAAATATGRGVLTKNTSIPVVLVGCRSEFVTEWRFDPDFVQFTLRKFCLQYGAGLCYVSASSGINVDLLRHYAWYLSSSHGIINPFDRAAQLVNADAVFFAGGWDDAARCKDFGADIVGGERGWALDAKFEDVVASAGNDSSIATPSKGSSSSAAAAGVNADDEQVFLRRLAGKQTTVPTGAAKTAASATTTMSASVGAEKSPVERKGRNGGKTSSSPTSASSPETIKTANASGGSASQDAKEDPALIANFFQSLLTRDKGPKPSFGGRRGSGASVRKAAEKALKKMRRKSIEKGSI